MIVDGLALPANRKTVAQNWVRLLAIASAIFAVGLIVRYLALMQSHSAPGLRDFIEGHCQWDCNWYVSVIEKGYDLEPWGNANKDAANWAFFPLVLLVNSIFGTVFGVSPQTSGFIVSNLLVFACPFVALPLLGHSRRAFAVMCMVLFMGPYSFYFSTVYSEAAFLLLTLVGMALVQRKHYLGAGLAGALLSATRVTGVFFALYMAIRIWQDETPIGASIAQKVRTVLARPDLMVAVGLVPLGLAMFMVFLHRHIGDALAFVQVQMAWGRTTTNPVWVIGEALLAPDYATLDSILSAGQYLALCAIGAFVLVWRLWRKRDYAGFAFSGCTIVAATVSSVISVPRFVIGCAPLLLEIMQIIAGSRWFWLVPIVLAVLGYHFSVLWFADKWVTF